MATLYPDISHYHPVSDWTKVKATCPFLISKGTQGTSYVDTTLTSFIKGCEDNKIPYWLYAYLNKGNELAQAKFLVSTCSDKVGSYFCGYIIDVEADNTASNVKSALDYLNGLNVKTMIYTMYSQYSTYASVINSRPSNCAWWEARYGNNTGSYSANYPCHSGVDLHQYTSKGSCSGISGEVDLNRIPGTTKKEEWFKTNINGTIGSTSSTSTASSTSYSHTQFVKDVQTAIGVTADSIFGPKTKAACPTISVKKNNKHKAVQYVQKYLNSIGYDCGTVDCIYGTKTASATGKYQKANSLSADQIIGEKTWTKLMS